MVISPPFQNSASEMEIESPKTLTSDGTSDAPEFPKFMQLPKELRFQIWRHTYPEECHVTARQHCHHENDGVVTTYYQSCCYPCDRGDGWDSTVRVECDIPNLQIFGTALDYWIHWRHYPGIFNRYHSAYDWNERMVGPVALKFHHESRQETLRYYVPLKLDTPVAFDTVLSMAYFSPKWDILDLGFESCEEAS